MNRWTKQDAYNAIYHFESSLKSRESSRISWIDTVLTLVQSSFSGANPEANLLADNEIRGPPPGTAAHQEVAPGPPLFVITPRLPSAPSQNPQPVHRSHHRLQDPLTSILVFLFLANLNYIHFGLPVTCPNETQKRKRTISTTNESSVPNKLTKSASTITSKPSDINQGASLLDFSTPLVASLIRKRNDDEPKPKFAEWLLKFDPDKYALCKDRPQFNGYTKVYDAYRRDVSACSSLQATQLLLLTLGQKSTHWRKHVGSGHVSAFKLEELFQYDPTKDPAWDTFFIHNRPDRDIRIWICFFVWLFPSFKEVMHRLNPCKNVLSRDRAPRLTHTLPVHDQPLLPRLLRNGEPELVNGEMVEDHEEFCTWRLIEYARCWNMEYALCWNTSYEEAAGLLKDPNFHVLNPQPPPHPAASGSVAPVITIAESLTGVVASLPEVQWQLQATPAAAPAMIGSNQMQLSFRLSREVREVLKTAVKCVDFVRAMERLHPGAISDAIQEMGHPHPGDLIDAVQAEESKEDQLSETVCVIISDSRSRLDFVERLNQDALSQVIQSLKVRPQNESQQPQRPESGPSSSMPQISDACRQETYNIWLQSQVANPASHSLNETNLSRVQPPNADDVPSSSEVPSTTTGQTSFASSDVPTTPNYNYPSPPDLFGLAKDAMQATGNEVGSVGGFPELNPSITDDSDPGTESTTRVTSKK